MELLKIVLKLYIDGILDILMFNGFYKIERANNVFFRQSQGKHFNPIIHDEFLKPNIELSALSPCILKLSTFFVI